jgi:hypothetical protein
MPPPAPAVAAVQVTGVVLGNALAAGKVAAPANAFAPKDTIYAVVSTTTVNPNASITAHWSYQGGQTVKDEATTLATPGPNTSTFSISKPDGFPAGAYTLDVQADGKSVSTTSFTVK